MSSCGNMMQENQGEAELFLGRRGRCGRQVSLPKGILASRSAPHSTTADDCSFANMVNQDLNEVQERVEDGDLSPLSCRDEKWMGGLPPGRCAGDHAQWSRMASDVLSCLCQHPACMRVTTHGVRTVIPLVGGLFDRRRQSQITCRMIAILEVDRSPNVPISVSTTQSSTPGIVMSSRAGRSLQASSRRVVFNRSFFLSIVSMSRRSDSVTRSNSRANVLDDIERFYNHVPHHPVLSHQSPEPFEQAVECSLEPHPQRQSFKDHSTKYKDSRTRNHRPPRLGNFKRSESLACDGSINAQSHGHVGVATLQCGLRNVIALRTFRTLVSIQPYLRPARLTLVCVIHQRHPD